MPEQREVYQNSQPPAAGASNLPTTASTGSTGAAPEKSASTSGAASATPTKRKSTRNAAKSVTVEQSLTVAQDIVRLCHDAGIVSFIVNTKSGDAAIVLGGVHYCETCRNLSIGAVCQKCESQK